MKHTHFDNEIERHEAEPSWFWHLVAGASILLCLWVVLEVVGLADQIMKFIQ